MRFFKAFGIVIGALLFVACLFIDIWFLWIVFKAPDKIVSQTYEIGMQETADGSDSKHFLEVNYFNNKNGNGIELFEIKFNYLLDENKSSLYSQGMQYFPADNGSIGFDFYYSNTTRSKEPYRTEKAFGSKTKYYYNFGTFSPNKQTDFLNYSSSNDYQTSTLSTNPLSNDCSFLIQLGDDIYKMKFKQINPEKQPYDSNMDLWNSHLMGSKQSRFESYLVYFVFTYEDYFYNYDISYLSKLLLNSVSTVDGGTHQDIVLEFGDIFDYYKYNEETKQFTNNAVEDSLKIESEIKSYYSVRINVSNDGARKYSDSLFNCINGNANYNTTGDYSVLQFSISRSLIEVGLDDLDLVLTDNGKYSFVLSEKFVEHYKPYAELIELNIYVDCEPFNNLEVGLNDLDIKNNYFYGFKVNSYLLENFKSSITVGGGNSAIC